MHTTNIKNKIKEGTQKMKINVIKRGKAVIFTAVAGFSMLVTNLTAVAAPLVKAETPWEKPTYVYGSGLNEQEIKDTAKLLSVDNQAVLQMVVDGADIAHYINGSSSDEGMISSVVVEKSSAGSGVKVSIVKQENITDINEIQYANAAITAGVKDVSIKVGAIHQVTGESALTGVYKAMEANGVVLDTDRMEVAQAEIETVNEISKDLKEATGFSQKSFDQVIINIKNELNIYYNNLPADKKITVEDIRGVVEKALKDNGLENVVTNAQIDQLTALFEKYAKTDAINSKEVIGQLKDLSSNLIAKAGEIYKTAEASGLLDSIAGFFRDLFNSLMSLLGR